MKPENKTDVYFSESLNKKQFEKFADFLAWLKKDKEKKDKKTSNNK